MAMMTSAYANKMLRKLNDDKEFWRAKEEEGSIYMATIDEEPVVPEYDYSEVSKNIAEIDEKIVRVKHAINLSNCPNEIQVGDNKLTIDAVLVKMAQLNKRKAILDNMRKQLPKIRVTTRAFGARTTIPEYQFINYDLDLVKAEYEKVEEEVTAMQIALDKYNQTVEFDVTI